MGPTLIFDKSLLQSLSVDESVFVQQFFIVNVTPIFYVETLGDLDLGQHKGGRPITDIISALAAKVSSTAHPNAHHQRIILGNLLGQKAEMDGRTIVFGGITKIDPEGKIGVHFDQTPEQIALNRWHKGDYSSIEREFSKAWRQTLSNISFEGMLGVVKNIVGESKLSSPSQVKDFVEGFINTPKKEVLLIAIELLGVPTEFQKKIIERWEQDSGITLKDFAPYAAFVFEIDLFFYICMLKGFEDRNRPSHKVDLSYLYYLPFCNVFVSSDKLHKRIAPMFMTGSQLFVDGNEFKEGLQVLDEYYLQYQDEINEKGFMGFAYQPPKDIPNKISDIWDKIFPRWRNSKPESSQKQRDPEEDKKLLEYLKKQQKESKSIPGNPSAEETHHMVFKHRVPVQKGKWRILPRGIENRKNENE